MVKRTNLAISAHFTLLNTAKNADLYAYSEFYTAAQQLKRCAWKSK